MPESDALFFIDHGVGAVVCLRNVEITRKIFIWVVQRTSQHHVSFENERVSTDLL